MNELSSFNTYFKAPLRNPTDTVQRLEIKDKDFVQQVG